MVIYSLEMVLGKPIFWISRLKMLSKKKPILDKSESTYIHTNYSPGPQVLPLTKTGRHGEREAARKIRHLRMICGKA